jgi:hypothetical protein
MEKAMKFENDFRSWMELSTDLAEKTISNYIQAMNKICQDSSMSELENITDIEKLQSLKTIYFSIQENAIMDSEGHRMYSAGFNKFISFRESQGSVPVGNEGIIYIISNPAMPGLVKIGKTIDLESRLKSLYSSGVPLPFRCIFAKKVSNYHFVEREIHNLLAPHRENTNREFFRIAEDQVVSSLRIVEGEDVTPKSDDFEDKEDEVAFQKTTRIGQRFNFDMVNIRMGSILHFSRDENITCKVISSTRVEFEGNNHSLSSAGLIAINRMGYSWKSMPGPLNWKYDGEVLDSRRIRLEEG